MATKKTDTKKNESTKKVSTKKKSTKKVEKTVNIDEKQFQNIVKTEIESVEKPTVDNWDELEKYKTSDGEYNLVGASKEEVEKVFNSLDGEDKIYVVNGDPSVLAPVEEPEQEAAPIEEPEPQKEEIKVETPIKKIKNKVNQYFDYLWNGQMIDF